MPTTLAPGAWSTDAAADMEDLVRSGRRAKVVLAIGLPIYTVAPAVQGLQVRSPGAGWTTCASSWSTSARSHRA